MKEYAKPKAPRIDLFADDDNDEPSLPTQRRAPRSFAEAEKSLDEWSARVPVDFSSPSKKRFSATIWEIRKGFARAALAELEYQILREKVESANKRKVSSRKTLNLGGGTLAKDALAAKKQKFEQEKADRLKRAKKKLLDQLSKAKKAHHTGGVAARRTNRENKKKITELQKESQFVPIELFTIERDPEKEPTQSELNDLLPNPSLVQAIWEIENEYITEINIDPELLFGAVNPTAPAPLLSDIEEEGEGREGEINEQVDIGSEGAGSIREYIMDLDADFISFPF